MNRLCRQLLACAAIAAFSLGVNTGIAADKTAFKNGKQKIVYHINTGDEKQLRSSLQNIQNHVNAVGQENIEIRAVMHGPGISLLQLANKDPDMADKVSNLKRHGVYFNVCANTLKGKKINYKTDLYDTSEQDIVPNGVAEVAHLQSQGFSYIKP